MANIMGIGMEVLAPAAIGAVSQVVKNHDAKKQVEFAAVSGNATKKFPWYKEIDTWVSFGLPVLGIASSMTNLLPIPRSWQDQMIAAGSVLAGQKVVQMMTKKNYHLTYNATENYYTGVAPSLRSAPAPRSVSRPASWAPANRGASSYNVVNSTDIMV